MSERLSYQIQSNQNQSQRLQEYGGANQTIRKPNPTIQMNSYRLVNNQISHSQITNQSQIQNINHNHQLSQSAILQSSNNNQQNILIYNQGMQGNFGHSNNIKTVRQAPHSTPNIKIIQPRGSQQQQKQEAWVQYTQNTALNDPQIQLQDQDIQLLSQFESNQSPIYAAYNIKNGLYIRPNSPNNSANHNSVQMNLPQNTRNQSRNYHIQLNNQSKLNNTAASNMHIEEEKNENNDSPIENFLEYRFRNFNIINPVPTEEDQDYEVIEITLPQSQNNNTNSQSVNLLGQQRLVPPPTTNLFSPPPNNTPPQENIDLLPLPNRQSLQINQNQSQSQQFLYGGQQSQLNSAPLLSPNQSDLWNLSQNLTAATSNTVGSTAMDSTILNMTPSEYMNRQQLFPHEQYNYNPQIILLQRPPPPSPLKTEENTDQESVQSRNQPSIIVLNDIGDLQNIPSRQLNYIQAQQSQQQLPINQNLGSQSVVSSVYQEVLENQQRSNQSTIRGLEKVIEENDKLKQQVRIMENEIARLQHLNTQQQRVIQNHIQSCQNITVVQDFRNI
ncbi:UNKNOWN [Stylonychia lemnae]|uniref:Uncharacterized protein n=1 Tax=Stylonychia lemnae TaxID=5949 RepID=A0A078AI53_STYLE|nr:UNKNOWN [Stylonychia lemnae]|eukprot:CDW80483.1 UNKNOWN [Stylonychia lemnae]